MEVIPQTGQDFPVQLTIQTSKTELDDENHELKLSKIIANWVVY